MYTRCPHCRTVFALHARELGAESGRVHCPECGHAFDALTLLFDSREEALAAATAAAARLDLHDLRPAAPGWALAVPRREPPSPGAGAGEASAPGGRTAPPAAADTVEIPAVLLEDVQPRPPHTGRRLVQGIVLLLLLFTLLGQGVYIQREQLYTLAEWQPWLERFCAYTGCELPLRRAPQAWVIQQRAVEAHPRREEALAVELSLVNEASHTQAYPLVGIFFSDLTGRLQAGRWFRPQDYLATSDSAATGVPAGAQLQLRLALVDPGAELVSYEFDFR